VRIETESLELSEFQTAWRNFLGRGVSPVLDRCEEGTWRGALRYQQVEEDAAPGWTGKLEVSSTHCRVEGLPRPLNIDTASATLRGSSITIRGIAGKYEQIPFSGEYSYELKRRRPHRLKLTIPEARAADLEALLAPAFERSSGLIARTLRRTPPAPEWLRARRLEGSLEIGTIAAGEFVVEGLKARLYWDGTRIQLTGLSATSEGGILSGRMEADLAGSAPTYKAHLELENAAWRDGKLDAATELEATGLGAQFLATLRLDGSFHARDVTLAAESEWHALSGCFQYGPNRLQLSGVQASTSSESYQGQGSSGVEGRLVVELANARKQARINGRVAGLRLEFLK
jgi:hypothetical protein